MLNFIFVIILIIFSILAAFLSASETAVTASSPFRLHQMAKKNPAASVLLDLQKRMPVLISCLLFTNICVLNGMASISTELFRQYLGPVGLLIAPIVMSALTALYVEILPKIYVYQCPERAALFLVPMLQFLKRFLFPVTLFMDRIAQGSLAAFGIKVSGSKENSTLEDLRGAIDLHAGSGIISHERAMLRSILDLSQIPVSEIMVHRKNIVSFDVDLPFEELCEHLLTVPYTRVPLWKDSPDNIVGVVHLKNLVRYLQKEAHKGAGDIKAMMKTPWFIPESSTLFYQMQLFKERHSHQAFVVDEYGSLLGMVTLEDILEEIVGEIRDEYDVDFPGVRTTPQGTYLIRGCVTLRDLHRQYEWNFEEPSVSTLAGLVLHECRTIPEVGTVLRIQNFEMKILRVHHHQVTLIEVKPLVEVSPTHTSTTL